MRRIASVWIVLSLNSSAALAQGASNPFDTSRPSVGGTLPNSDRRLPGFEASGSTEVLRHRSVLGKPCLLVLGEARPHTIDPNLYDHVIVAVNGCPQRITLRACYYQTDNCTTMEVPGNERKEAILGTLPAMKDFRFEFRERF
jgi:hypothetical protein